MRIAIPKTKDFEDTATKNEMIRLVRMFEDAMYGILNSTPLISGEDKHEAYTTMCREFYKHIDGVGENEREYYVISVYKRESHYGGAEEGGWNYKTEEYIESKEFPTYGEAIGFMRTEEDNDPSGERQFYLEAIIGQNEDMTPKHYE